MPRLPTLALPAVFVASACSSVEAGPEAPAVAGTDEVCDARFCVDVP